MKAIIIADVHSNVDALEAIWRQERSADAIYCAGDVVDLGPSPNEVIGWLMDHGATCIRGNHDELLLRLYDERRDVVRNREEGLTWLEYNAKVLSSASAGFLRRLPESSAFSLDGHGYFMRHAYRGYETVQSKHQLATFLRSFGVPEDARLVLGHTHRQCVLRFSEQQLIINPGSTAFRSYLEPDDPNTEAEYAVVQDGQIRLCSVDYDKTGMRRLMNILHGQLLAADHAKLMRRAADSRRI